MRIGAALGILGAMLLLLAGCLDQDGVRPTAAADSVPVHDGEGRLLSRDRYAGDLPRFEQRFVDLPHFDLQFWPGFEPTVDFAPDGTAFFSTFSYPQETDYSPSWEGPRQALVLVASSDDRGLTWTDVSPTPVLPDFDISATGVSAALLHGGDVVSYADAATGQLFVSALAPPCAVVYRTSDEGTSWTAGLLCDTQGQGMIDHQAFFTGPATTLPTGGAPVVYMCWSGLAFTQQADVALGQETAIPSPDSHRCVASLDGGDRFTPIAPPFLANGESCWPYMSQGATTGPDGTIYLPQAFCDRLDLAVSRNNGLTWEVVTVDEEHGTSPDIIDEGEARVALDSAGNLYYAWIDAGMLPRYAVSRDQGRTWSDSVPVHAPGLTAAARPSLVAGDEGRIAMSYLGTSIEGGPAFLDGIGAAPPTAPAPPAPDLELIARLEWSAYTTITLDALADDPVFATGRLNPAGDSVHRGYEFGGIEDYADNGMDPSSGAVWYSSGDTCHPDLCPVEPIPSSRYWEKPSRGYVGVQVAGTGLLTDGHPSP